MRSLPWKEGSVQTGGLDERTSNLFLIVSILILKKSRMRFGRSIREKTVGDDELMLNVLRCHLTY